MEEILASIRRIIADDEETGDAPAQEAGGEQEQDAQMEAQAEVHDNDDVESEAAEPEPPEVEEPVAVEEEEAEPEDSDGMDDDVFELSEVVEDEEPAMEMLAEPEPEPDNFDETVLEDDIAFDDPPAPEAEPEMQEAAPVGDTLLSDEAQSTASAAFGMLASSMLSHSGGARTLEGIVEDLLRPLLKTWLDENLPPMVEQIVREEIERVARRR